jgi:SAM-dependent methyltransferase
VGLDIFSKSPFKETEFTTYRRIVLGESLPLDDDSVDVATAFDVLEHVPRWDRIEGVVRNPFIDLMSDIHRILKSGGYFIALTPCFPHESAFVDPTHVNTITPTTHNYFAGPTFARRLGYGYSGRFTTTAAGWAPLNCPLWRVAGAEAPVDDPIETALRREEDTPAHFSFIKRLANKTRQFKPLQKSEPTHFLWVLQKR